MRGRSPHQGIGLLQEKLAAWEVRTKLSLDALGQHAVYPGAAEVT